MQEREAIQLIQVGIPDDLTVSTWADLGCGSGTFTKALAQLLGNASTILAVDKEVQSITSPNNQVTINFQQADFTKNVSSPQKLDGILMANSLHYVKDQVQFLTSLKSQLQLNGRLIIIEYDTDQSNPWVPYPVSFKKLVTLLSNQGFTGIQKIGERPSVYNQNMMYACVGLT